MFGQSRIVGMADALQRMQHLGHVLQFVAELGGGGMKDDQQVGLFSVDGDAAAASVDDIDGGFQVDGTGDIAARAADARMVSGFSPMRTR